MCGPHAQMGHLEAGILFVSVQPHCSAEVRLGNTSQPTHGIAVSDDVSTNMLVAGAAEPIASVVVYSKPNTIVWQSLCQASTGRHSGTRVIRES